MQPYFFPYIGYFQLISIVDKFVIHDDIQYIKGGWINRNRILYNGAPKYIVLSVSKDSFRSKINERYFTHEFEIDKKQILRQIEASYRKAPYFDAVYSLIEYSFLYSERNIAKFLTQCLVTCCSYLKINTEFIMSSNLGIDNTLKGTERVIEINKMLEATHYINLSGGLELYNKDVFSEKNIKLNFIKTKNHKYSQFSNKFISSLSIIDVMMFNNHSDINKLMNQFEIL